LGEVVNLMEKTTWIDKRCGHKRYNVRIMGKIVKCSVASGFYGKLYKCRNDFL
jgi:hypothetical protein